MKDEGAAKILREVGLKRTPGRIEIINLLLQSEYPLSQDEISNNLAEIGLDKVTIYRALEAFLTAGIVHRIETGDRVWRFALCACGSNIHCHPHFICKSCGKVECLNGVKIPTIINSKPGYFIEEQEVYLKGLCPHCAATN